MIAMSQRLQVAPDDARPRVVRRRRTAQRYILNQALLRHALVRERKRADRFEQPFGLVLISLSGRSYSALQWPEVIEALNRTRRDTDVVGWYTDGTVLGVIRAPLDMDPHETGASLETTMRRDLEQYIAPAALRRCNILAHIYSSATEPTTEESAETPASRLHRSAKRALDVLGSGALLAACSPVFLVVAALVRFTSPGPVFYRQERVGRHGRPFRMLKFRTMHVNAGHELHRDYVTQFIQGRAEAESISDAGPVFKLVADPRITRVGAFLRRSSLDEIPQFLNVLRGEMSLVGPRPPLPYEVKCYRAWHWRRLLEAKPGITGLWQVKGRSRTTFDEMVRMDIRYAKTQSIWADLKILLATPLAVISGNGAH